MAKRRKKKQPDAVAAFVIGRTAFKQALAHVAALEAAVHGLRDVTNQLVALVGLKQRQSDSAKRAAETRQANASDTGQVGKEHRNGLTQHPEPLPDFDHQKEGGA